MLDDLTRFVDFLAVRGDQHGCHSLVDEIISRYSLFKSTVADQVLILWKRCVNYFVSS